MRATILPALAAVSLILCASTSAASPLVIAHRGGALLWPENTIYALEQAAKAGADYLEFDLQSGGQRTAGHP